MLRSTGEGSMNDGLGKRRYLLFDSGCSECTDIARAVEEEAKGWLTTRSLRDPDIQNLLSKTRPDYGWEPTILEVEGEKAIAYTGIPMKIRLVLGLGARRAARIAKIVRQPESIEIETASTRLQDGSERHSIESIRYIDRRAALKAMGAFGLGAALVPMLPQGVLALTEKTDDATRAAGSRRRSKFNVTKMKGAELKQAFTQVGKDSRGKKLLAALKDKGFAAQLDKAQGGNVTSPKGKGFVLTIPYKDKGPVDNDKAQLYFTNIAGRVRTQFIIFDSGGDAEVYSVKGTRVEKTYELDFEAYKRRARRYFKNTSRTNSRSTTTGQSKGSAAEEERVTASQAQYLPDDLDYCAGCKFIAGELLESACAPYFVLPAAVICEIYTLGTCTIAIAILGVIGYFTCQEVQEQGADLVCGSEGVGVC